MKNLLLILFVAVIFSFGHCLVFAEGQNCPLLVGVAVSDITPTSSYRMSGYFSERLSTGTLDPLLAKAIVFSQGDEAAALLVLDVISVPPKLGEEIRQKVAEVTSIPASSVLMAATHTHTGPLYHSTGRDILHERAVDANGHDPAELIDYPKFLVESSVKTIQQAWNNRCPAKITAGKGETNSQTQLSFNRRFFMKDGSVIFNPGFNNPETVRIAGTIDPEINVALLTDIADGKPICSITNFALHLDTTGGTQFSGDYPFYLSEQLKKHLGDNFVSIFGNGTCGDINHIDFVGASPIKKASQIGQELGELAWGIIENQLEEKTPNLATCEKTTTWSLQSFTAEEIAESHERMHDIYENDVPFIQRVLYSKIYEVAHLPAEVTIGVQAIRLSDSLAIITLPNEVFVDIGLAIKEASPFTETMVIELAPSYGAYLPTRKAFGEGSYETVNTIYQPGVGEKIMELAIEALKEIHQQKTTCYD